MKFRQTALGLLVLVAALANPVWSDTTKPLTVNELAAKPKAYIGKVTVVGRVAAISPGKGFTLIDKGSCANCATECDTDKTMKKIPFLWSGTSPVVKGVVLVEGMLANTPKGFIFTAEKVKKQ